MDMQKYYSPQALERLHERQLSPEEQQRVEAAWQSLFADVEAALGEDPAGERGKAIAARWRALIAAEMLVRQGGLGDLIFGARTFGQIDRIIVGMIVIGCLYIVVDRLIVQPIGRRRPASPRQS